MVFIILTTFLGIGLCGVLFLMKLYRDEINEQNKRYIAKIKENIKRKLMRTA